MEMNKPTAPIITVIHTGNSNLNRNDTGEMEVIEGNDRQQKSMECIDETTEESNKEKQKDDDQESVIIEEMENNTIEVEEDSGEEEDGERVELNNTANESFTKATEFVIVNAAKVLAAEVADEAESTNKYPIEDVHIKDELAEAITADLNTNDVLENDPMDLLEINTRSECTSSIRSQDDTEDYGDDVSSAGSSSAQTASSSLSVLDWVRDYPWLLYEEGCEQFGHCLYCDTKINIKSQRSVKQHGLSLYHKERCENYLAFQDEEEKNGLSMQLVEIKEEFGTDSRVEALKLKRKSQSAALNNFNWRRWLMDYPWLERDSAEGTVGYCRYCLIHVNVEFSYLRDRHQEGSKHKEAEKQYEESNKSNEYNQQDDVSNVIEETPKESTADVQQKSHKWLEHVKNEPTMVRCKLCSNKMVKNNFLRHLRTNLHENNEKLYLESQKTAKSKELDQRTGKYQPDWKLYAKNHPWLVPDPTDPSFAYCKYCDKRIIYGSSAAKRAVHENSSQHKLHESEFKKPPRRDHGENQNDKESERKGDEDQSERNGEEEDEEEEEEQDQNEDNDEEDNEEEVEEETNDDEGEEEEEEEADEEDESQQAKESTDENDSKKRIYRLTEEWINQYSWCKRYNKDPTNYFFCIYCRIPLRAKSSRSKHQTTSIHISAEKEYLSRQVKRQKFQEKKQGSENPTFYEWAIPLRNNPNNYSCRYCRVRISKNYSKKQHASSKIHQINESIYKNNRRKSLRRDENSNSSQQTKVVTKLTNVAATKKGQTFAKVVIKAPSTVTLIKQWQKKFPWLTYKRSELRSNYGHCKMCESSLFIRSLKHVLRHVRSPKHVNMTKAKKKEKLEKEQEETRDNDTSAKIDKKGPKEELQSSPPPNEISSQNQTAQSTSAITESPKAFNYKSTIAELKKRFSWIEKSESPNYAYCRFCNTNIPIKILFLRNHSNSLKHRHSVVNYNTIGGKKANRETQGQSNAESDNENDKGDNANDMDDDVMIVEENNEEILISEQDENWAVKSETMDEHEELDYLLQRSFNNSQNKSNAQRNVRKNIGAVDENPPTKRIKRSQSFRRFNDSNTSLVASLLTTPLTLASCLGPLIQQQIQQANSTQTPLSTAAAPEIQKASSVPQNESANTFDLFFKSISETMKKLPIDLAAEGKLRVMQIICDLELQALKRQQSSVPNESSSSNTSGGAISLATSTSTSVLPALNSSAIHDPTTEQNGNSNETIITQLNAGADVSPTSAINLLPTTSINPPIVEKPLASTDTSPIIGVMDKNGLQTIQLKTSVAKQIPRSSSTTTVTSVANSGIRCIPFKNLSQATTPDTNNTKITRIQVPLNVAGQASNPNANTVNNSKNLLNFRNIQITKRIATPPASASAPTATSISGQPLQQTVSKPTTVVNKSPQRTYITNIQPQMQRWSCSVNGATTSHHTPTSSAVNHLQQLSSQQTSTPISKKH
ncbi:protein suppressor of variegation 3-7 [Lucilia sericata]|uniref:protein suppressor of variegation 3-7 n=1 Tax=Lucilia sericata TaxID=13632 RepID=UPI0018A7F772|nr:protein suppressor of variegation 3-7 [Lucilia sericata]